MLTFGDVAEWAVSLRAERIPDEVRVAAARERASVRAAIDAAWTTDAGRRWGRATPPGYERDAGLSALLDFDDYGFLAHPGHSAAVVAGGHEEAHVAAAELALRLGAAALFAPAQGQGLTFVHAPAAALAAGVKGGLDAATLGRALALASLAPATPTWGGLLATRAKPARVAEAVATGIRACALASASVQPPRDALAEGLAAAAYAPLPRLLGELGDPWLLPTLSFKPRPASACLQAALAAFAEFGPLDADEVSDLEVAVPAPTLALEKLVRRLAAPRDEPIATQFSLERALRVALAHGDLTPETLERPVPLGPAVRLRHEPAFTRDFVASLARGAPLGRSLRDLGPADWLSVLLGVRRRYGAGVGLTAAARELRSSHANWNVGELELVFPARVLVRMRGGEQLVAERRLHPGQRRGAEDVDRVIGAKEVSTRLAA